MAKFIKVSDNDIINIDHIISIASSNGLKTIITTTELMDGSNVIIRVDAPISAIEKAICSQEVIAVV